MAMISKERKRKEGEDNDQRKMKLISRRSVRLRLCFGFRQSFVTCVYRDSCWPAQSQETRGQAVLDPVFA